MNKTSEECQSLLPGEVRSTALYKRRWAFLFGIFLLNITSKFSSVCFGLINDIFIAYFDITNVTVDWLTLTIFVTSGLAVPVLAWLSFANRMGIRSLILVENFCLTLSYILIVIAIAFPEYYLFLIFGQLAHGVTHAIQWSIPPLFAVLWFPNNEVGIAIAANFIGAALGAGIGFAVPPLVLTELPYNIDPERSCVCNGTGIEICMRIFVNQKEKWIKEDRDFFLIIFGAMLALTAFLLLFFFKFLTDLPPKPPTTAQAMKRNSISEDYKIFNKQNIKEYFGLLKKIFSDRTVVLLFIVYSLVHRAAELEVTLMGELIRPIASKLGIQPVSPNKIACYIMVCFPILTVFGSFISGKLSDKYEKFRKQATIGAGMTFLSTVGIAFSYHFPNFIGLCVFNGGFGFSIQICIIPLLAVVTRHTFPVAEAFVSMWVTGFESIVLIVISEIGRVLINSCVSKTSVFILMSALLLISFLLVLITKPRDRRSEAEENANAQQNNIPTTSNSIT